MATDFWPQEEGAVFDAGSYILPCYPDGAISEMSSVTIGTSVAGRISVAVSAAVGDGIGIALRAATGAGVPIRIPVIFYGACKVLYTAAVAAMGKFVINATTTTFAAIGATAFNSLVIGTGASYVMGLALQGVDASGEGIILVGKTS